MGGFGAFQLGCFAPEIFEAVVSVAGYGLGTSEPNSGYGAPQPASGAWDFHMGCDRRIWKVPYGAMKSC